MGYADQHILGKYARATIHSVPSQDRDTLIAQIRGIIAVLTEHFYPHPLHRSLYQKSAQRKAAEIFFKEQGLLLSTRRLLNLLSHYGRLHRIETFLEILQHHVQCHAGLPSVCLFVYRGDGQKETKSLQKIFGAHVPIKIQKKPRILGGYLLEIDGFLIDRSVQTYIGNIQKKCKEWLYEEQRA